MELLGLYDEKGDFLNKSIERGKKFDEDFIMISIGVLKNDKDEYLIQKTSKEKGSLYSLTGGHVLYKETPLEAMIRETKEELGIDVKKESIKKITLEKHPKGPVLVSLFEININCDINNLKLQKEEVESAYFYTKDKVLDLINNNLFHPTHSYFFKKYFDKEN